MRMQMISVKMMDNVCYIDIIVIMFIYKCLNTNVFMFGLIPTSEITNVKDNGRCLVQKKYVNNYE